MGTNEAELPNGNGLTGLYREVRAVRQLIEGLAGAQPTKLPDATVEELAELHDEIRFLRRALERFVGQGTAPDSWVALQVAIQDYPHCLRDTTWQVAYRDQIANIIARTTEGVKLILPLTTMRIGPVDRLSESRRFRPGQH